MAARVVKSAQSSARSGNALSLLGFAATADDTQAVVDQLVASGFSDFLGRAPGVERYFRNRNDAVNRYLKEVVANTNAHEEEIIKELLGGKRPTRVLSMDQTGFTYAGARGVFVITTDVGKFLYKPHSMRYTAVFTELCRTLLPGRVYVPHVIDCGNACLCEFVETVPPAPDQLNSYYESLGGYLALAYFLSLTDQHAANILPVESKIAPIDVETLLLACPFFEGNASDMDDPALSIRSSIVSTGMLSYDHNRLVGSLFMEPNVQGIASINTSTKAIEHLDDIAKGFAEAYRTCLESKSVICQAIKSLADVDLRILMAPGSFYQGLQSRFFRLDGWDQDARLQDLDNILRSTRFKRANPAVFEHERAVLIEHDIPYFTVKAGGIDLMAEGKPIWNSYFSEPPTNSAILRVMNADESDLEWQLTLLCKLIKGMPRMSKTRVPDILPENKPLTQDQALLEAGLILHQLYDERISGGTGAHALMAFSGTDGSYSPMDASFSWGYAGVGVFAAACKRCGAGDSVQAQMLLDLCLKEMTRYQRYFKICPRILSTSNALDLKTGLAGFLRASQLIWCATHDSRVQTIYAGFLKIADMIDTSIISNPAVLSGIEELLAVLKHHVPGLPECASYKRISEEFSLQKNLVQDISKAHPGQKDISSAASFDFALQNSDNLFEGNASTVEKLIRSNQIDSAGCVLAAMVARRHQVGHFVFKGAWRVPYFDPTLFYGATGIGYELLRYAKPAVVESLFL